MREMMLLESSPPKKLLLAVATILSTFSLLHAQTSASVSAPGRGSSLTPDIPATAHVLYDRAVKMGKAGKAQIAISLLRESIRVFPRYFEAHLMLGNELGLAGRLDEAIAELEAARKLNGNDDRVYHSFGAILIAQRKYALAAAVFAEAARLNPTNPRHQLMRGVALLDYVSANDASRAVGPASDRNFMLGRAEEALDKAYQLSGRQLSIVHFYLGMLYDRRADWGRAADELEQYLRESPQAANADAIRGLIAKMRSQGR